MDFEFERKGLGENLPVSTRFLVWILRTFVIHRHRLWSARERFACAVASDILRHNSPIKCTLDKETFIV
jgi:hypothetical protein